MEDFPRLDRRREHGIAALIEDLKARAPEEPAMRDLSSELLRALGAARNKNNLVMNDSFGRAYNHQNMLATKGVDVLVDLEQVMAEIKALSRA